MSAPLSPVQRALALSILVLTTAVALLATSALVAPQADAASQKKVRHAMRIAKRQIGDPYSYGADGPGAFDCSGLTYFAYKKRAGMHLPRTSSAQYASVRHIPKKNLERGDFIFFIDGGSVYHMGVYMGRHHGSRIVLHSPSPGEHVKRDPLWTGHWKAGTLRKRGA